MEPLQIGTATIEYSKEGKINRAEFKPMNIEITKDLQEVGQTEKEIKEVSEKLVAKWFAFVNGIELADQTEYEIFSEIKDCVKYTDGKINVCVINFYFKQKFNAVNN